MELYISRKTLAPLDFFLNIQGLTLYISDVPVIRPGISLIRIHLHPDVKPQFQFDASTVEKALNGFIKVLSGKTITPPQYSPIIVPALTLTPEFVQLCKDEYNAAYVDTPTGSEVSVEIPPNAFVGKSAYETWLDLGNTGTEQDFIDSLKGEPGEDGKDDLAQKIVMTPTLLGALSILPGAVAQILGISNSWHLVGYSVVVVPQPS